MNKEKHPNKGFHENGSPILYENPILEKLSCTQPRTLALVFTPIIVCLFYLGARQQSLVMTGLTFLFGLFLWTFFEYLIHRFAFHYQPGKSKWEKINPIYYGQMVHNIHHSYPNDKLRIVTPIIITLPLAVVFYFLFSFIFGIYVYTTFSGFLLGYMLYDLLHARTHINPMPSRIGKYLKFYHMRHHYQVDGKLFGVTMPLWDHVFKTYEAQTLRKPKI